MKKRTCADRLEQNQKSFRGGLGGERRTHMTLSQIIAQALRQLGEDPQDVSEVRGSIQGIREHGL